MSTSHLERTAAEPRYKELHPATISRIDEVNDRVRLFRLELQSGPAEVRNGFPPVQTATQLKGHHANREGNGSKFSAGQWLDTYVPGVPRAGGFSITSAPSAAADPASPYVELAVQKSPGNAPAAWLWRPAGEIAGETLQVRIGGGFVFPPADVRREGVRRVVFVAGGVGVNPLMSMLSGLAEGPAWEGVRVEVLYATKMPVEGVAGILFLERIARLYGDGRIQGRVRLRVTGGGDTVMEEGLRTIHGAEVDVQRGRISRETLLSALGGEHRDGSLVYICGPPAMTDEFVEVLTARDGPGLDPRRVKKENWW